MMRRLTLENFTVFSRAEFEFAGLDAIHGENSTGKTHLLKLVYAILSTLRRAPNANVPETPTKSWLESELAKALSEVFRPEDFKVGRLVRRQQGRATASVRAEFEGAGALEFSFSTNHGTTVKVEEAPTAWLPRPPIYLPTRELLSVYPGFVSLYETQAIPFDRTWRDTCAYLGAPVARGPKSKAVAALLKPLEDALGCQAMLENGRFFVKMQQPSAKVEADLVAEGLRKLTMVARLIANGSLDGKGALLWDEPEANLNPALVREVAPVLWKLAAAGVQVFLATHSLFLLTELELLRVGGEEAPSTCFIGLHRADDAVAVTAGATLAESGEVAALREDLQQADRALPKEITV